MLCRFSIFLPLTVAQHFWQESLDSDDRMVCKSAIGGHFSSQELFTVEFEIYFEAGSGVSDKCHQLD